MINENSRGAIITALHQLVDRGWIPLRSMSCLLGYSYPSGIYGRQRSRNAITTIKVGGQYRVSVDVVLDALRHAPCQDHIATTEILHIYETILKQKTKDQSPGEIR